MSPNVITPRDKKTNQPPREEPHKGAIVKQNEEIFASLLVPKAGTPVPLLRVINYNCHVP